MVYISKAILVTGLLIVPALPAPIPKGADYKPQGRLELEPRLLGLDAIEDAFKGLALVFKDKPPLDVPPSEPLPPPHVTPSDEPARPPSSLVPSEKLPPSPIKSSDTDLTKPTTPDKIPNGQPLRPVPQLHEPTIKGIMGMFKGKPAPLPKVPEAVELPKKEGDAEKKDEEEEEEEEEEKIEEPQSASTNAYMVALGGGIGYNAGTILGNATSPSFKKVPPPAATSTATPLPRALDVDYEHTFNGVGANLDRLD